MHGRPLTFLDSAASAQKARAVIDAMNLVMHEGYANIHRGLYELSQSLTHRFELVRERVADFIGAESKDNIVFTRNATEGFNLIAQSWGRSFLKEGDEIILTEMEHHANIVPWQILRNQIGIVIRTIPVTDAGELELDALDMLLTEKTRCVSFVHVSNALGTINPAQDIIRKVKAFNPDIVTVVDGTQAVVHKSVNVQDIGCDFFVFTGHKLYGPTGVGVFYGKKDILDSMPPYQGGGDMIETVTFEKTAYKPAPYKFEAGTPPIIEVIGLGAAIDYVETVGMENIAAWEEKLLKTATDSLADISGLRIYGQAENKASILSFNVEGAHPSDVAVILDQCGVAMRTGHHCCMPLMRRYGVDATLRASFALYSNEYDIIQMQEALHKAVKLLVQ